MNFLSRALFVVLIVPTLLLGGSARAQALFKCEYTKVVYTACCCPSTQETGPALDRACCCEHIEAQGALPLGSVRGDATPAPVYLAPVRISGLHLEPAPPLHRRDPPPMASKPLPVLARAGPSLIVMHRRFLI
jgi:hypothetical protein